MILGFFSRSKICPSCKVNKPFNNYAYLKSRVDGYQVYCKICHSEKVKLHTNKDNRSKYDRSYRINNKNKIYNKDRKIKYKNLYDISIEDYDKMLESQNYSCAMCGKHQEKEYRKLCIDHDHNTGKVRGILCSKCNINLGIYESIKELAENYLEKFI